VAVASGATTLTYWWLSGDKEHALIRTATVLIIACPHALGLAIPLVIAISTSFGAKHGLLVKNRLALERARNLDMVILDKTGTLTRGSPALSGVAAAPGSNESDLDAVGTDVALETADIALMSDDLSHLPFAIAISKKTSAIIKQNIVFSISIKAVFIVLALVGWATLWMAVAADMGASVAGNHGLTAYLRISAKN
jgi:cation transport ATPase